MASVLDKPKRESEICWQKGRKKLPVLLLSYLWNVCAKPLPSWACQQSSSKWATQGIISNFSSKDAVKISHFNACALSWKDYLPNKLHLLTTYLPVPYQTQQGFSHLEMNTIATMEGIPDTTGCCRKTTGFDSRTACYPGWAWQQPTECGPVPTLIRAPLWPHPHLSCGVLAANCMRYGKEKNERKPKTQHPVWYTGSIPTCLFPLPSCQN